MPRIATGPAVMLGRQIVEIVKGRKAVFGYSVAELSAKCGMSPDRYSRRMRHPEELTLKECWALEDALRLERGTLTGVGGTGR